MPDLESMRRRLSSIAKPVPELTTPPSHTHPDARLLDPDFFNIGADDLTWFHEVNLAVRHEMAKTTVANDYMHIQRVTVSAWNLYQSDASQPWARNIDPRTIVVAAMISSLGAPKYTEEREQNEKKCGCRRPDSPDLMQHIEDHLLFGFLRRLDCPPDVAGPAALIASLVSFSREVGDKEEIRKQCEAYPALRFVQDAVRLDDLGCVGIARLGAQNQRTVLEMVYRMDVRLLHYMGLMKTKGGRKEAERRWAQMMEFREGLLCQTDCSMGLTDD
ncbi:hypothetical protein C7974DRAFT_100719 [Boeremia exigua]|uniref:uncharacterized protein n=1 Tax=Boeremia exigua TaxID=749465 RepID=UPI001E8ED2C0|nr:uncharacterized protein C7974DRAFT_100719 [Boeremia exigua]KAH6642379.1 hypothetical protein C7974DRAFT_100719 [Boeremia exigua]